MLKIIPIRDGDIEFVRANPFCEAVKTYPDFVPAADSLTTIFDGEVVAVGGMIDHFEGVGELWLMMTKQARKHDIFGLIALCAIGKKVNELIADHKLRRVEAKIRADFPEAIRMIEAFGFDNEGCKREATPDRCDLFIYGKLI